MNRDKIVAIRFTPDEKTEIEEYAKKKYTNASTLIRQVVMQLIVKEK